MPAPRPPRLTGRPSPHEMRRASQQIARAVRLTADQPLRLTQGQTGSHLQLDKSIFPFLARLTSVYTLTSSDVGAGGAYQGMTAGTNVYAFVEQTFDQTTGLPLDAPTLRQTLINSVSGHPQSSFALEVNNRALAYNSFGALVEMRLRGIVGGAPIYEFRGELDALEASFSTGTVPLSSSWSNVSPSNLALTFPASTSWLLTSQLTAQISPSSTGGGDSVSFRYYDGTNQYGVPATCCSAVCGGVAFTDAAPLTTLATIGSVSEIGGPTLTIYVQGIINTSSGSTANVLPSLFAAKQLA